MCIHLQREKQTVYDNMEYETTLLLLNCAINPLAYVFFKRDIKKEIRRDRSETNKNRLMMAIADYSRKGNLEQSF